MTPKILTIDIETSPNLADVWSIWNVNVNLNQLRESSRIICWGAKWYGEDETIFMSEYSEGYEEMLAGAYYLLDEADIVVHYNGDRFDIPWLQGEFARQGWTPPATYQNIDLIKTVKKQFRFPSNKLEYVVKTLGLQEKLTDHDHSLWTKCLMEAHTAEERAVKAEAWQKMEEYCRNDVEIEEALLERIQAWIPSMPTFGLYGPEGSEELDVCQNPLCGSDRLQWRGYAYTKLSKFHRYVCKDCGKWGRSKSSVVVVDTRSA